MHKSLCVTCDTFVIAILQEDDPVSDVCVDVPVVAIDYCCLGCT